MKTILDKYESNNFRSILEEDIVENYIKKYDANEYEKYLKDTLLCENDKVTAWIKKYNEE